MSNDAAHRADLITRIRALSAPLDPIPTNVDPVLPKLDDVRGVLFDVYGTLFISGSGDVGTAAATNRAPAFVEALRAVGVTMSKAAGERGPSLIERAIHDDHNQTRRTKNVNYPEVDIRDIWSRVLEQLRDDGAIDDIPDAPTVEQLAVEYECRVNPVWPMPGVGDTLTALRERGLRLGIVSNAQFFTPLLFPALLDRELGAFGFDAAACRWSYVNREAKPFTRMYEDALQAWRNDAGIEPRQVLYIGNDMRNDIWPASRLGCRTALFAGDQRSLRLRKDDKRLTHIKPDVIIGDLSQLLSVL